MMETLREAMATLKYGIVTALDATTHRVRVRLPDLDDLETAWLPVLTLRTHRDRFERLPDVGEHVAVLLDARGEDGLVLGAIFSARDPSPGGSSDITAARFADGGLIQYDRASGTLTVIATGPVVVQAGGPVTVTAPSVTIDAPQVTVTGHLTVGNGIAVSGGGGSAATISGNVAVEGSISASGSIMDAGGNSNHHSH